MTRSPEEVERDVEKTREKLDATVEALKSKMSPGQLLDEAMSAFGGGSGGQMFNNLGSQIRDNPLPVALIGAGVAWLMMGSGGAGSRSESKSFQASGSEPLGGAVYPESSYPVAGTTYGGATDETGGLREKAGEAAAHAKDGVAHAVGTARDKLHAAKDEAAAMASNVGRQASDYSHQAQAGVKQLLDSEPLLVGAIGLTVGIALGAAFPSTPVEDKLLGETRDKVLTKGRELAEQGLEAAKEVANSGLAAANAGEGATLSDNIHNVVDASLEAAKEKFSPPA
jgi:hypothetical protein